MRYVAILKDSFREALDSWVLLILIVVSTLAILGVATLSFTPLPAKAAMEQFFPNPKLQGISMMFVALNHGELNKAQIEPDEHKGNEDGEDLLARLQLINEYRLENVELLRGEADSPESDYVLTLIEAFPRVDKDVDQQRVLERGRARVRMIFQRAEDLEFITIGEINGEIELAKEGRPIPRVQYRVTIHGTPRTFRIWAHEPSFFFGVFPVEAATAPLGYQLYVLGQNILSIGAWVAIVASIVITSFFIPNMLNKGAVEMMLVKPINRWSLILYKYVGGLSFIFLVNSFAIGGMWFALGIRTGLWANGILLLIGTLTFYFAILYAVSTFVSVGTRSTIATIMVTIVVWVAFASIGMTDRFMTNLGRAEARQARRENRDVPADKRWSESPVAKAARLVHAVTPRTEELNQINDQITYSAFMTGGVRHMEKVTFGERPWWESVLVAFVWIVAFLGLSCTWFSFRDY